MKSPKTTTAPNHHQRKPAMASPIGGVSAGLKHIELATDLFSVEFAGMKQRLEQLRLAIAGVRAVHLPRIRAQRDQVAVERKQLSSLIDLNRSLFVKPRTYIFSETKVGLQKQKGSTIIADEDKTIELIGKHFPDRLDELAPAERSLSKKALNDLTADELKKIGVEITADTDKVLIAPQDSDVEKAVAALLAEDASQ